ncbi:MAG: peptide chain release factor N(5)-glutamine methyltransferase, partial [Pseudomonadota bacterium]
ALDDAALIAEGSRFASERECKRFAVMVSRRADEEPVAYIVGRREFWSLEFDLAPGILVPRADSETLIEAVARRRRRDEALRIADLGCGSGALLCALLSEFPRATGLGVDINPEAVAVTARNLTNLGFSGRAHAKKGDWFESIGEAFDVIVSNPPYIRTVDRDSLPREVRDYESPLALFAGEDGLAAYRDIVKAAPGRLAAGGLMVLEFGAGQAGQVNEIARAAFPRAHITVENDLEGRPRALVIDLGPAGL